MPGTDWGRGFVDRVQLFVTFHQIRVAATQFRLKTTIDPFVER